MIGYLLFRLSLKLLGIAALIGITRYLLTLCWRELRACWDDPEAW